MALHMLKLSVGSKSIESLSAWQDALAKRRKSEGRPALPEHITRMVPRRKTEILAGGSIYWVIKGMIQCRNEIIDLEDIYTEDGRKACKIVLKPGLIPVVPTPKRAFQGWRYLKAEDAPLDLTIGGIGGDLPAHIRNKLVELGAW